MRLTPLLPLVAFALFSCSSTEEDEETSGELEPLPRFARVENVALERPGFRLLHPANWSVDTQAEMYDPDRFFILAGPEETSVAFMILEEPADPEALVDLMLADHGLEDPRERTFDRWGRYEGVGVDVSGVPMGDVPSGMRAFAWSSDVQSFVVAQSYTASSYAVARSGFDVIENSFALSGTRQTEWPAVSPGSPSEVPGELVIVRPGFRVRFRDDWKVDVDAEDYDPDRFFSLKSPYESCWAVVQILEQSVTPDEVADQASAGMRRLLESVGDERSFTRWGAHTGAGREVRGEVGGLAATVRVFCRVHKGRALLVTEYRYDELAEKVQPGFLTLANSFEFLD